MTSHLRAGTRTRPRYACGVGRRWPSQTITSTSRPRAVTCAGCRRTRAWRDALAAAIKGPS